MSGGKELRILSRRVKQRHVERFAGACGISLFTISSSAYGNLVIAPRLEHAPDFLRAMLLRNPNEKKKTSNKKRKPETRNENRSSLLGHLFLAELSFAYSHFASYD